MLGLLVLIVSVAQVVESLEKQNVIAVYDSSEEIDLSCVQGAHLQYNISDLPSNFSSNTVLRLCSNLVIEKNIALSSLSNVTLVGYESPILRCPNGTEVGLVFTSMHNLELLNFAVIGCGMMTDVDTDPMHNIKASMTIKTSINISIVNVTIAQSPGSGLAMFYNNGSIMVYNSTFEKNGLDRSTGGNGAYVETGPAVSTDYLVNGLTAEYMFMQCQFITNIAATGKDNIIKGFSRFDKGGGLCFYILASEKINATITNAIFASNQAEHYGGGLFVSYLGKSRNNNILVLNSRFIGNSGTYGGATYSGYIHTRLPVIQTPINCSHLYESVSFLGNSADFGGGSSIFSTKTLANDSSAQVKFEDCTWENNVGQYGSAVAVLPNAWNLYSEGYLPTPRFIDCTIDKNFVRDKSIKKKGDYSQYAKGSGAFYCFGHNILFEKFNYFRGNVGSAMYLGSCLGIFTKSSYTLFSSNYGYQGGAIYELSSVIYIHDNATMNFFRNSATDKGGAIYEHTFFMHIYDYSRTCFIDYIDNIKEVAKRNISVTFEDNKADNGHSIFASSLRPCYNRFSFSAANLSIDIFDQVGNFTFSPPNRPMEIATTVNHSNITDKSWSGQLAFVPGKETKIPFFDVDDLNQNVITNYLVTIANEGNNIITTSKYYSEISSNILLLYGKAHSNATVTLSDTTSRQIALEFHVTMQPCPPGFIEDESHSCICSVHTNNSYIGVDSCNLTLVRAYQKRGYWIGYKANVPEGEDTLISGYCPHGFCSTEKLLLPGSANREDLNQFMCSNSRTGILCGQCKENFSVHYHSSDFKCKSAKYCSWGWLFYILSVIVPVTIFFLVVIFFNIPFTSGMVNGFIFYCQVVENLQITASGLIPFSDAALAVNEFHSLVYLSFSLDMFVLDELSFCLWKGASAVTTVAFNYVTLVYAFFLILLITLFMKKCSVRCHFARFSKYVPLTSQQSSDFHGSIIHGLSAFLILCYAQCAHSSVLLLTSSKIFQKGATEVKRVVYYNGEIEWMSLQHMPYAIPAIILSTVIVVLPPILLLIYPYHYKVLSILRIAESRCTQILFNPIEKLKPFFDSFQSCFKDEYRFFAGLYFVYRFFIMFNIVINYLQDCFFILEIQLVAMLVLHSTCQPYKERLHNVIDTLLIGNLAIINAITYYNFSTAASDAADASISITIWVQTILIILPLPFMLLYLVAKLPVIKKCLGHRMSVNFDDDDLPARLNYGSCDTCSLPESRDS